MKKIENYTASDWVATLWEGTLIQSMRHSKTLTIMTIVLLSLFASFIYFLYKVAGA